MLSFELSAICIAVALVSLLFSFKWLFTRFLEVSKGIRNNLKEIANIQKEQTEALRDLAEEISQISQSNKEMNNED